MFCILVHIIPQVYWYSGESGREHLSALGRYKRVVPILVPILVGLGIGGSVAVGTAALITGEENFKVLASQVDSDLKELEKSVNHLEQSLSSLAEVVLQNRRGLDLLFLKQGGLCVALGETCCFYVNHSGIIKESLSLLRNRLKEREELRSGDTNWYEKLFSWSPWLTTMLSAAIGPLMLVILGLLIGPCLVNCLMSYIKKRLQAVKLMALHAASLRTAYSPLSNDTESTI